MYGIYANIGGILMVNVTIYSIHGSYGIGKENPQDLKVREHHHSNETSDSTVYCNFCPFCRFWMVRVSNGAQKRSPKPTKKGVRSWDKLFDRINSSIVYHLILQPVSIFDLRYFPQVEFNQSFIDLARSL